MDNYKHVYFACHVPPWPAATWHNGKQSDDNWLPWFCSVTLGEMIERVAATRSDSRVTVLCGHCFDASTELLTARGWVSRAQLKNDDLAMTWNRDTDRLELNVIEAVHDHAHSGDVWRIRSRALDLMVTPGHGLIDIDRRSRTPRFFSAGDWDRSEYTFMCAARTDRPGLPLSDDEIRLVVWIVTDGAYERDYVRWHFRKERKIAALAALLTRLGIPFSQRLQKHGTTKINVRVDAHSALASAGTSTADKHLPALLRQLSSHQIDVLLAEYAVTDGYRVSKRSTQICSAKETEIDLLQELAIMAGRRCTKLMRTRHGRRCWILTVNDARYQRLQSEGLD